MSVIVVVSQDEVRREVRLEILEGFLDHTLSRSNQSAAPTPIKRLTNRKRPTTRSGCQFEGAATALVTFSPEVCRIASGDSLVCRFREVIHGCQLCPQLGHPWMFLSESR